MKISISKFDKFNSADFKIPHKPKVNLSFKNSADIDDSTIFQSPNDKKG